MALERKDRIKDTTTTTGTGTVNLDASAPTGFRTFVSAVTSGATVRYLIESSDSSEWEVGEGVFTDSAPDTLTRVTVYASSNAGSLVNFSAGAKNVSLVATAADFVTDGWQNMEALTYVSADGSTGVASIASDVTGKYTPGMRLRYEQSQALSYYWSFDSSSAADLGTATMGNVGTPTYSAGKFSNALTLNGTDQALTITDAAGFKPTGEFTIGCWFKTSATGAQRSIFQSYSANTNTQGISIGILSTNVIYLAIGNNTSATPQIIQGYTVLTDNSFHYIVLTFRNNFTQIYIDGILEVSSYSITPTYAATNYVRIGCLNSSGSDSAFWSGQIDDLFIINGYALDEKTIKAKYDAQTAQGTGNITVKKYGIITAVGAYSAGITPITFWGGTDHSLANSTISSISYSTQKVPFGFPLDPIKWTVGFSSSSDAMQSTPTQNQWYNPGTQSLSVPIGIWEIRSKFIARAYKASGTTLRVETAFSSSASSVSHNNFLSIPEDTTLPSAGDIRSFVSSFPLDNLILTSKTTFYLIIRTPVASVNDIKYRGDVSPTVVNAVCAYL